VAGAARRGIVITNTPDVLTEEVADTTLGLLLATVREFYDAEKWLRDGRWPKEAEYRLTASVRDRKVGIAGFGRIGKAIAHRLEAFGLDASYFGRKPQAGVRNRYYNDLVAMARDIDTLILVIPRARHGQSRQRRGARWAARAASDQHGARLGGRRGRADCGAAGAQDPGPASTYVGESTSIRRPELDNVTLLPHVGSASIHTRSQMGQLVVDNLIALAEGKPPKTLSPRPRSAAGEAGLPHGRRPDVSGAQLCVCLWCGVCATERLALRCEVVVPPTRTVLPLSRRDAGVADEGGERVVPRS
jgi:hypothetical protein